VNPSRTGPSERAAKRPVGCAQEKRRDGAVAVVVRRSTITVRPAAALTCKSPERPTVPAGRPLTSTSVPGAARAKPIRAGPSDVTVIVPSRSAAAAVSTVRPATSASVRVISGRAPGDGPSCQASLVSVPGSGWVTGVGPERWSVPAGSGSAASAAVTVAIVP